MVATVQALPDDPMDLASITPQRCCDDHDITIDSAGDMLSMRCRKCKLHAMVPRGRNQLRGKNKLKRLRKFQKQMAADIDALFSVWNRQLIENAYKLVARARG